jgi:hypothetical protein
VNLGFRLKSKGKIRVSVATRLLCWNWDGTSCVVFLWVHVDPFDLEVGRIERVGDFLA